MTEAGKRFQRIRRLSATIMDRMVPADVQEQQSLAYWRVRILFCLIVSGIAIGFLVFVPCVVLALTHHLWRLLIFDCLIWIVGFYLLLARLSYNVRAGLSLATIYALGTGVVLILGPLSGGPAWLFGFTVFAGILLGFRAGMAALMLNASTLIAMGWLFQTTGLGAGKPFFSNNEAMIAAGANFLLVNALATLSVSVLFDGLVTAHDKERLLTESLTKQQENLIQAKQKLEREIEERMQTELSLSESQKHYKTLFESSDDGVFLIRGNTVTRCNRRALELMRKQEDQIIGKTPSEGLPNLSIFKQGTPSDWNADGEGDVFECQLGGADESPAYVQISFKPIDLEDGTSIQATLRDITQQKKTQEIMVQTEKMMSIGGLAAGMAHEINNPLAGIIQNTQVIMNRFSPELPVNRKAADDIGVTLDAVNAYLERRNIPGLFKGILEAGKQATRIVDNMLSFSRKSPSNFTLTNIPELLEKSLILAQSDYNLKKQYDFKSIDIVLDVEPELPSVVCEPSMIQQVFFNILKNGAETMADRKASGGYSTGPSSPDRPRFHLTVKSQPGYVCTLIEDNGMGMDEETRKRIFEPFFTTKDVGTGTGLGLSVSYFIIKEHHNGIIDAVSTPGSGSRLHVCLPLDPEFAGTVHIAERYPYR